MVGEWVASSLGLVGLALTLGTGPRADVQQPIDLRIGKSMPNFTLPDVNGKPVSLYGFAGKPGAVLVFTGTDCPLGNLYLPRLIEEAMAKTY